MVKNSDRSDKLALPRKIYLGLGSNQDRKQNLANAIKGLKRHFKDIVISPVYETRAVGFKGKNFYNLVAGFTSAISLESLGRIIKDIETHNGRIRTVQKYSDRSIDIDILLFGDAVLYEDGIDIPRREISKYSFALKPLADIAPNLIHPYSKKTMSALWNEFSGPLADIKQVKL